MQRSTHRAARARCNAAHASCNAMHRARRAAQLGAAQPWFGLGFHAIGSDIRRRAAGRLASLQRTAQATAERCAAMLRCAERCACRHRRPRHTPHLAHRRARRARSTLDRRGGAQPTTDSWRACNIHDMCHALRPARAARGTSARAKGRGRAAGCTAVRPCCNASRRARANTAGSGSACTSYDKTYHHHIETLNAHSAHARAWTHAHTPTPTPTPTRTRTRPHSRTRTRTRTRTLTHMHTRTHIHSHAHARTHAHTHTHTRTRTTHTRTHTHTRACVPGKRARAVAWHALGCVAARCAGGAHAAGWWYDLGTAGPPHRDWQCGNRCCSRRRIQWRRPPRASGPQPENSTHAHARAGSAASCTAHCAALHHALRSLSTRGACSLESHQRHERSAGIHCSRENS
jgi:hypothetical protein